MKLKKLSASSIKTYDSCQYRFKLNYIDKIKPPVEGNQYTAFGRCIHSIVQRFYTEGLETYERMEALLVPTFDTELKLINLVLSDKDYQKYLKKGERCLSNFIKEYNSTSSEEAKYFKNMSEVEKRFDLEYNGIDIVGYIDFVSKFQDGAVIDYKTGAKLPPISDFDNDVQLTLYSWAALKLWNIKPKLCLFFLDLNKKLIAYKNQTHYDELFKKVDVIVEHSESGKEFEPTLSACRFCEYNTVCQYVINVKKQRMKFWSWK